MLELFALVRNAVFLFFRRERGADRGGGHRRRRQRELRRVRHNAATQEAGSCSPACQITIFTSSTTSPTKITTTATKNNLNFKSTTTE